MAFGVMGGQYQATGHMQILSGVLDRASTSSNPRRTAQLRFDGTLSLEPTVSGSVADESDRTRPSGDVGDEPLGGFQAVRSMPTAASCMARRIHRKDGIALAA